GYSAYEVPGWSFAGGGVGGNGSDAAAVGQINDIETAFQTIPLSFTNGLEYFLDTGAVERLVAGKWGTDKIKSFSGAFKLLVSQVMNLDGMSKAFLEKTDDVEALKALASYVAGLSQSLAGYVFDGEFVKSFLEVI